MKNIFKNRYVQSALILAAGILLGSLLFGGGDKAEAESHEDHDHEIVAPGVWTCSMHPQIRMDKPGKCPICAMDLIPVKTSGAEVDASSIALSENAMILAGVKTTMVTSGTGVVKISLYGTVGVDERTERTITSHVPGRIEKLNVTYTGEMVKKGSQLALVYSPDLVTAQKELLEAKSLKDTDPRLIEAARAKLLNWKLTKEQVDELEKNGRIVTAFPVVTDISGYVTGKEVREGDYVDVGSSMFRVADLSNLWGIFEAYETDLSHLRIGEKVTFTVKTFPGESFSGIISFIDPVVDQFKRTAGVRVDIKNSSLKLKPGMFMNGVVEQDASGKNELLVPNSAILWTGKRSVLWVKNSNPDQALFSLREVTLGNRYKERTVILSGLNEGEEVVSEGAFSVDAAAQLEGKPSMLNTEGGAGSTGHDHGTMKMDAATPAAVKAGEHAMFRVRGACSMCKDRIEAAAMTVKGVTSADWDEKTQMLHLGHSTTLKDILLVHKAIAAVGHDTEKIKADDKIYSALPACCLYRDLRKE